jgi:hypothetical protein
VLKTQNNLPHESKKRLKISDQDFKKEEPSLLKTLMQ